MNLYLKVDYLCCEIVKIHAHLCGDGNLYTKIERRSPSNRKLSRFNSFERQILEYTNTCQLLLDKFQAYVKKVAPKTYIYRDNDRLQVRNKLLYLLMKKLGCGNTFEWSIPNEIRKNPLFRGYWLAAFFDDEGCISKDSIRLFSSNLDGILQVKEMLELDEISLSLHKRTFNNHYKPAYTIRIKANSNKLFKKLIPFSHPNKKLAYKKYFGK